MSLYLTVLFTLHSHLRMPIFQNGMPNDNGNPRPLVMSVVNHNLPNDTHECYTATFDTDTIQTLYTFEPDLVDSWLLETLRLYYQPDRRFIVGFDIQWRPNFLQPHVLNPVSTIQLCVDHRCLVFQVIHALHFPDLLSPFLSNPNHTFLGFGIERNVEKLLQDCNLRVANSVDLRSLAANVLLDPEMLTADDLRVLAHRVLGKNVEKPLRVTMSRWDDVWLTDLQVQYATLDAFLSFDIARRLYSRGH